MKTYDLRGLLAAITFFLIMAVNGLAQDSEIEQGSILRIEDFDMILGDWEGSLTYLDYSSNQPFTMPANLIVKRGSRPNTLVLSNIYPNEPKANGDFVIKIGRDGKTLNKKPLISKNQMEDGQTEIILETKGKDGNDNKKALIREIYKMSDTSFSIRKEVLFDGESDWILRNEFKYSRNEK